MKIIIAGAYAIGTHLARLLSRSNEKITLIDESERSRPGEHRLRLWHLLTMSRKAYQPEQFCVMQKPTVQTFSLLSPQ